MPVDALKARLNGMRETFSTAQLVIIGVLTVLMFWTSRFWVFYDDQD